MIPKGDPGAGAAENIITADVHAEGEDEGAVGGADLLGGEVEVEPDEDEPDDDEEEDDEEEDDEEEKGNPTFDEMIASGHIRMKVCASR